MSKFKAFDKRDKTLLVEYKNMFKANKFVDKRLGENDQNMTLEDKMFKRFVVERQKHKDRRASKFNLNDDDGMDESGGGGGHELTHLGQSLSQIEKFENVRLDSDEDDEDDPNSDRGRINAKIVSDNFFGGFGEEDGEDAEKEAEKRKKSRKEWIDEMIAKSKQVKYERQRERDKTLDLTEELDKEWAAIRPLISKMSADAKKKEEEAPKIEVTKKPDDFDCLIRSLQFDSKAQATDKTKTPQELEKERQEALKKQEQELLERMKNEYEADEEESDKKSKSKSVQNIKKNIKSHVSADDIEFDDPEYVEYFRKKDLTAKRKLEEENEAEKKSESVQLPDEDDDEEDESDEEEELNSSDEKESTSEQTKSGDRDEWPSLLDSIHSKFKKGSLDLKGFEKQFDTILAKLDPSKDEKNKQRLCSLVQSLIDIYQKECSTATKDLNKDFLNVLVKNIYALTFKYGSRSTRSEPSPFIAIFKNLLNKINKEFVAEKLAEHRFPGLDKLFIFRLISIVFPASDYRHLITTPTMIIMARYLGQCSIDSSGDLFRGLHLCHLFFEYIHKAKRLVPECIQFINGVLYLGVEKIDDSLKQFELSSIYETFKKSKLSLKVSSQVNAIEKLKLVSISKNESSEPNNKLKVSLLAYALDILNSFATIYKENICFRDLFSLTFKLLELLPKNLFPEDLQIKIEDLKDLIASELKKPREHLKCLNKKPEPGKQFEPKIVSKSKFDPRHHNSVISEKQLNARKYKKELRSAIKEIRNDNQYLARVQFNEQMEKDSKRKQKVKEIMGSLASQEGEYQKAKRQKS